MEAVEGAAPEVTVHKSQATGDGSELSAEEQAIHGIAPASGNSGDLADEDADGQAALAEGRAAPPRD